MTAQLLEETPDVGFDPPPASSGVWDPEVLEDLVQKILVFTQEFNGRRLFDYQRKLAYRIIQAILRGDGATITALQSRQSGKSEVLAAVIAALMVLLPKLALVYPDQLGKYSDGFMVGTFAPVDEQAQTLFTRIVSFLKSKPAQAMLVDPEIDDKVVGGNGKLVSLKNSGSFCRMQTAHPKANIESKSYHFMVLDEAQTADTKMVNKSIRPMGAFYRASIVYTGTTDFTKGVFYKAIQANKRSATEHGGQQNHYEFDWRHCAAANPDYAAFVASERQLLGEDSDEFQMSYMLKWPLETGMFTTVERLAELGDANMEVLLAYHKSPLIAGLDLARKIDSTVLTVVYVDWDWQDPESGYYDHRILNWLELRGDRWEEQYTQIADFLTRYSVTQLAVDGQGVGDVVADRLERMLPDIDIKVLGSNASEQSARWKHLMELINRGLVSWPAHHRTKRLKLWQRFVQQMGDLQKDYKGQNLVAAAPREAGAHDDFPDSLSLACWLTKDMTLPTVQTSRNVFFERGRRSA